MAGYPEEGRTQARSVLRRVLRVVGLILFAVIGAVVAKGQPANGVFYHGTGEVISALVVGVLVAFLCLAIVGSIGYWISQRRHRDKTWSQVTFGRTVMIITLFLLIASAAGRASSHQEAVSKAKPNPSGSLTEREKANLDAQDWSRSRQPLFNELKSGLLQNPTFLKMFTAQGNTASVRARATRIEGTFQDVQTRWEAQPQSPLTDLRPVDAGMINATGLAHDAYADYVAGLKANAASGIPMSRDKGSLALLTSGDVKMRKSVALLRQLEARLLVLDKRFGIP